MKTEAILNPRDSVKSIKRKLTSKAKEHFFAIYLDARSRPIYKETISIGTIDGAMVHPREVFAPALKNRASSIIILHNHPSGDVEPSDEDLRITQRLKEAGKILGIEVIDHVIFSDDSFYSLRDNCQI